jgi:glycerophosphoryl diester phosphodiesterase
MAALHPYLDWPGPIAMAHRGGSSEAPENTMPAFEHAIVELGYRYVETDAQVTADGVLLAFHDDDLLRTCGRAGVISTLPFDEVSSARVDGTEPIPLMDDLLGAWPEARVNIDCKSNAAVEPMVELMRRHDCLDRVCIGSFDDRRMARLRTLLGPRACTSFAQRETALFKFTGRTTGGLAAQIPATFRRVAVPTRRFVRRAHERGIVVHVWTINERDDMIRFLDLGVDGLITDRPAELKQVLLERGQWHE